MNRRSGYAHLERLEARRLLSVEPTPAEQYMLEMINRARANPAAEAASLGIDLNEGLASGTISPAAKQPLALNPNLIAAARSHSNWMIQTNTFGHNEGSVDPGRQMRSAGYPFNGSYGWGQNIAFEGTTPMTPPLVPTTDKEERDLFIDTTEPGRGHRLNILNPDYKEIGIGVQSGTFQGYNSVVTSQDFADQAGGSFLTGVAYTDAARSHFYVAGEGLGGVTITAVRQSDQAIFSTTTWSAGGYTLPLDPGAYTVSATGAGIGSVSAGSVVIGSQNVEVNFTPASSPTPVPPKGQGSNPPPAVQPGWVSGNVFRDSNANGIKDRREPGQARWRVFVDLNNDGIWERGEPFVMSNGKGNFQLQLAPGTYTLREVVKKGFICTTTASASFQITIGGGQSLHAMDFGNHFAPPVHKHARSRTALLPSR